MMSLRFFRSLGFGIERIGLLPLRAPWLAMLALAVFSAYCATGVMKLETDDALSDLFRSQSEVYSDYKVMSDLFPSSERDVLVVIEGKDLLSPTGLEAIRNVHQELEFVDSVDGALSLFSMRGAPNADGYAPPMIPSEIPKVGEGFELVTKGIKEHPLVYGKMISEAESRGFGPKATPPPRQIGDCLLPARARPVPFWRHGLALEPRTSLRVLVEAVPARLAARCWRTTSCSTYGLTLRLKI